jgi:hypothetical protein
MRAPGLATSLSVFTKTSRSSKGSMDCFLPTIFFFWDQSLLDQGSLGAGDGSPFPGGAWFNDAELSLWDPNWGLVLDDSVTTSGMQIDI